LKGSNPINDLTPKIAITEMATSLGT